MLILVIGEYLARDFLLAFRANETNVQWNDFRSLCDGRNVRYLANYLGALAGFQSLGVKKMSLTRHVEKW